MRILGIISTALFVAVLAVAIAVGLASTPDIKRYLEMRRM